MILEEGRNSGSTAGRKTTILASECLSHTRTSGGGSDQAFSETHCSIAPWNGARREKFTGLTCTIRSGMKIGVQYVVG
ncbi:unnamed protein product [Linum tenue]|uniref:Uncharacterized protein n=1 Tax=Linum tenue TaxID=586396 RepID=A0AAV0PUS6_9ROSI|nr:unnamed protein product [Linum tenue]